MLTAGIGNWQNSYWDRSPPEAGMTITYSWAQRQRVTLSSWSGLRTPLVASRIKTMVCDVKKALETTLHMEDRGRSHWFLGRKIRREEGESHSRPRTVTENNAWAVSNVSMQTLKKCSWFKHETSDSSEWRRRTGSKDLQKLDWITSVSGQTGEARHHSQHSVQTLECTYQSILTMRKTTSAISSKLKRFKTYLHKRS